MFNSTLRRISLRPSFAKAIRSISILPSNRRIFVHPTPSGSSILSLLPTSPPSSRLAIGTTSTLPPTPDTLTENAQFLRILSSVLASHAASDPTMQSQAAAFASTSGSALGSGGMFFPRQPGARGGRGAKAGDGAGGASSQGGAGGGGKGGFVHVSDLRAPPDYGRIAWPEDIFGSLEVDGQGRFVDGRGNFQWSGTYRVVTREGVLGLSDYLMVKVVERLQEEEKKESSG